MKHALLSVVFGLFLASTATSPTTCRPIKLLMKDGRIIPETLEVPANTRFRLEVKNEGPGAAEFESLELKKELVLAPGVTRIDGLRPDETGHLQVLRRLPPGNRPGPDRRQMKRQPAKS